VTAPSYPLVFTANSTLGQLCHIRFAGVSTCRCISFPTLSVILLFHCLALLFSKGFHRSSLLNFAIRMVYYPHNPQSHRLAHNIIIPLLRASGPTTGPINLSWVFSLVRCLFHPFQFSFVRFSSSHSHPLLLIFFSHVLVSLRAFPHVCFAKLSRVNTLF